MKPHHYATGAALLGLLLYAVVQGRAVSASAGGLSISISTPPEIVGEHVATEDGWIVTGPAVITATMPGDRLREVIVPKGATRRVRIKDGVRGMTLEVER